MPTIAVECPAGDVCYLGECRKSCNAGREGIEACTSDGDCGGARSECVSGFCSACPEETQCIPALGICAALARVDEPIPNTPSNPNPPAPLDGGTIDGGLRFDRDGGVVVPPPLSITHAGRIEVTAAALEVWTADVSAIGDDRTWRAGGIYEVPVMETGACRLTRLATTTVAIPRVSFGDIEIGEAPGAEGALGRSYEARFSGGSYAVSPAFGGTTFSGSGDTFAITVTSTGEPTLLAAWPEVAPVGGIHVPFVVVPAMETADLLARGVGAAGDVRLSVEPAPDVLGEVVAARISVADHELVCESRLDGGLDAIDVPRSLLDELAARTGAATAMLSLERRNVRFLEARLLAPGGFVDLRVGLTTALAATIDL
jgi:hypothetical protein